MTVSPNGSFMYVADYNSNAASAYSIGPGGLLTPLSTASFATGAGPYAVVVVP